MNHLDVGIFSCLKNQQEESLFPKGEKDMAYVSSYAKFEV